MIIIQTNQMIIFWNFVWGTLGPWPMQESDMTLEIIVLIVRGALYIGACDLDINSSKALI